MSRQEMAGYIFKYFRCYIDVKSPDDLGKLLDDTSRIALNELQKYRVLSLRSLGSIVGAYCEENNIGFYCEKNTYRVSDGVLQSWIHVDLT